MYNSEHIETSRHTAFDELVQAAGSCRVCPRMIGRRRLLSRENGKVPSRVMFVAEAPGRLGGERTGIPMAGDQTGKNLDHLLAAAGLSRNEIFITNAVLCNPRDVETRNAKPSTAEIRNCSHFLKSTIDLVDPAFVIALGSVALNALQSISPHAAKLPTEVGTAIRWYGRWLIPLYHPSPRAQIHRPFDQQREDFARLGELVRQAGDV